MPKLLLEKQEDGSFKPCTAESQEKADKYKLGDRLTCEIKKPRNPIHHARYFALLNLVLHNLPETYQDRITCIDDLLFEMKLQLHHFDRHITLGGKVVFKPRSINFASMGQAKFNDFYSRSIDVILKYFMPGTDREKLEDEVLKFV